MHDDDTKPSLPSLEALVAGTVALMTAWADPSPPARGDLATQRRLLARKIVSNLFFIQHHPCASAALRQVMANAHAHWVGLAGPAQGATPQTAALQPSLLH
ncbi:MAG: hypothetical protein KBC73_25665 [Burkholderiaceae bacterium]|nr:hypothetical protein [Burkholderiaceae bacterium]